MCGRVDVFFSGHDHDLQWLKPVSRCGKTEFIVSGAGAKKRPLQDLERNAAYWQMGEVLGFYVVEIEDSKLSAQAYVVDELTAKASLAFTRTIYKK